MSRTSIALPLLLAVLVPLSSADAGEQGPPAASDTTAASDAPPAPRFIDRDGDGFNDLAPDADGDAIPDALDPDFALSGPDSTKRHELFRWAWYRALPDSARADSTRFRTWWEANGPAVEWRAAWDYLKQLEATFGPDGRPRWWDYDGFDPRRSPFWNVFDRRQDRERR